MSLLYIVDGYNVIHKMPQIKPMLRDNFEGARDAFIDKVARFCGVSGSRVQIVFDGRGRRAESVVTTPRIAGLDVIYSSARQSADAFIERGVYMSPEKRHIVVVSGDSGIRDLCRNLGALVMSPDNFLATMREAAGSTRESIEHHNRAHRPLRVEDRLSDEALRGLRNLKHKLEE